MDDAFKGQDSTTAPDLNHPQTVADWRRIGKEIPYGPTINAWHHYDALWAESGLTLYDRDPNRVDALRPDRSPRTVEEGVHSAYGYPPSSFNSPLTAVVYAAVDDVAGRDVILRVMQVGPDGQDHLEILRSLSTPPLTDNPQNHCLPILRELLTDDIVFAVLPFWDDDVLTPYVVHVSEACDFLLQSLEGLAFFHEHLIAHRDIAMENIVVNHVGLRGPLGLTWSDHFRNPREWRSLFPARYCYIDFEHAVRFDPMSNPSAPLVKPIPRWGREAAPEIWDDQYNPFPVDVFALGLIYWQYFETLYDLLPGLEALVEKMLAIDPRKRYTAGDALLHLQRLVADVPAETMGQRPPLYRPHYEGEYHPHSVHPGEQWAPNHPIMFQQLKPRIQEHAEVCAECRALLSVGAAPLEQILPTTVVSNDWPQECDIPNSISSTSTSDHPITPDLAIPSSPPCEEKSVRAVPSTQKPVSSDQTADAIQVPLIPTTSDTLAIPGPNSQLDDRKEREQEEEHRSGAPGTAAVLALREVPGPETTHEQGDGAHATADGLVSAEHSPVIHEKGTAISLSLPDDAVGKPVETEALTGPLDVVVDNKLHPQNIKPNGMTFGRVDGDTQQSSAVEEVHGEVEEDAVDAAKQAG